MLVVGILMFVFKKVFFSWKVGLLLMIPCIIDGSTQYLGQKLSNNALRSVTGALAGVGAGVIIFPLYFKFVDFVTRKRG